MITILAGTNRPHSRARRIADYYRSLLAELGAESHILDLAELPVDFITTALYANVGTHPEFNRLATMLDASDKVVIVVPEYNASFPGVLKAFIDGLSYPGGIQGKKAALVGLSSGGQGGLLAMAHLTDVLMYLGTTVLPQRVRLPFINQDLNAEHGLNHDLSRQLLREQATALLAF
ncbi:NAD(P)H-dependent oxidoreductase [Microvirga sp. STS02]|uniref:NADPH-dependent FMN reductase n=1 Tax=Hymenobacter negativus TaxID=2795026 RepID=UPI0018DC97AB|nr:MULTISPECIES: NAD(P)H-dependent oxidoreductase [Bacteria]MBH8567496.1 NAD(P)H-dependent oxidoreductase [Hymenobacter negativus]MBR7207228.1 NAD(P)H-dependent oxidoreductase [Microvirga sp. STS02]